MFLLYNVLHLDFVQKIPLFDTAKKSSYNVYAMTEYKESEDIEETLETVAEDTFTDTDLSDLEENSTQKIKSLQAKLKEVQEERQKYHEDLQRAKAEFLNAKKRIEDERLADRERAIVSHIEKLLPLCDSFTMAMSNKTAWESVDQVWRSGIEGIFTQLQSLLSGYNVIAVAPIGLLFDPQQHDALGNVPVENKEDNGKIVSVIQNGYVRSINGQEYLIRPARVTVGEYLEKD
jgi:molecular chaperone GrpE